MNRKHISVLSVFWVLLLFSPMLPDSTFCFSDNSTSDAPLSMLTNLHATAVPSSQMADNVSSQSSQASVTTAGGKAAVLFGELFEDRAVQISQDSYV